MPPGEATGCRCSSLGAVTVGDAGLAFVWADGVAGSCGCCGCGVAPAAGTAEGAAGEGLEVLEEVFCRPRRVPPNHTNRPHTQLRFASLANNHAHCSLYFSQLSSKISLLTPPIRLPGSARIYQDYLKRTSSVKRRKIYLFFYIFLQIYSSKVLFRNINTPKVTNSSFRRNFCIASVFRCRSSITRCFVYRLSIISKNE